MTQAAGTIAEWLAAFDAALVVRPSRRARILAEMEGHLVDAAAAGIADGLSGAEAERRAVARFGEPAQAAQFRRDAGGIAQEWVEMSLDRLDRWRSSRPWVGALLSPQVGLVLLACLSVSFRPYAVAIVLPLWLSVAGEGRWAKSMPGVGHRAKVTAWRRQEPARARAALVLAYGGVLAIYVSLFTRHLALGLVAAALAVAVLVRVGFCRLRLRGRVAATEPRLATDQLAMFRSRSSNAFRLGVVALAAASSMLPEGGVVPRLVGFACMVAGFEVPRALVLAQLRRRAIAESLAHRVGG